MLDHFVLDRSAVSALCSTASRSPLVHFFPLIYKVYTENLNKKKNHDEEEEEDKI